MEQLIPVASKLQDVFGALGQSTSIDLPQVVVVGSQSAGKSSVLEAIVGRSFLPRGSGICTRRPLVLQLYNTTELEEEGYNSVHRRAEAEDEEWGEFLHLPGKRYFNFKKIRDEIIRETDRASGTNKGITNEAIHLKIYSPKVLTLTLVDLPGITKVAVGDQPEDIEVQIRAMCLTYISNPNAIILAVTASNTDLANSDAIQLARQVDPDGERTLGVLTKIDLMDAGTDAVEMLQNKVIPLRRGYIAVMNRGQKDVNEDVSIRDGLVKEKEFFKTHPSYRHLQHKCGTPNLAKSLNSYLMHHIRDCLPEIKNRIAAMMADIQIELEALGSSNGETSKGELGAEMLRLLSKFSSSYSDCIDGKFAATVYDGFESSQELYGGARIAFIFKDIFSRSLMSVDAFDGLSDDIIRTTIINSSGTRPALFVSENSFEILVKRQIARLEQPGLQCVDLVFDELQRMASQCEPIEFQRFPELRDRMVEVTSSLLRRCVQPTQMMISNLVKIELSYINTSHPDFIGGSRAVARLMEKKSDNNEKRNSPSPSSNKPNISPHHLQNSSSMNGRRKQNGYNKTSDIVADLSNFDNDESHDHDDDEDDNEDDSTTDHGGLMNFIFRGKKDENKRGNNNNRAATGPNLVQLPQIPDNMRQNDLPTDRERIETEIIKSLIKSYFAIARKNFIDLVPKTIMYFLVNHSRDSLQNELVSELYRESQITDLMKEASDIAQRRNTCIEMRDLLHKALEIVNEVRDFNTFK